MLAYSTSSLIDQVTSLLSVPSTLAISLILCSDFTSDGPLIPIVIGSKMTGGFTSALYTFLSVGFESK